MEDKKKTLTEYEKEISEAQEMEEANTHKRKVRSFKRMLMVTFLVVCAIPITLCMFLDGEDEPARSPDRESG